MTDRKLMTYLVAVPSVVITLAGIKAASSIIVPLLLAFILATIAGSFVLYLQGHGLPKWLSRLIVLLAVILLVIGLGLFVSAAAMEFSDRIPYYQSQFLEIMNQLLITLNDHGITLEKTELLHPWSPMIIMGYLGGFFQSLQLVLAESFMILILVVFFLFSQDLFFQKMHTLIDEQHTQQLFGVFSQQINRYVLIKSTISALTGMSVAAGLYLMGIEHAFLWGVMAFMFNFIPNIGSIIAAVPPMLLALADHGLAMLLWVGLFFLAINVVFGVMIEPRITGKGLGLSSVVVLLSLIFWGWILGPVGMLLSIPLTIMVKVACDLNPRTQWISILLSDEQEQQENCEASTR
jgi:predicted PurR-regulated permease PerM